MFNRKYMFDLAERALATYVQAFVSILILESAGVFSVETLKAAAMASIPAALSVIKSQLAQFVGDPDSAGFDVGSSGY